jgi:hypothetical protein
MFTIQMPAWEEAGTPPPEGSRKAVAGTFANPVHYNAIMTAIRADHVAFADALARYGMASFFDLGDMVTLVETDDGVPPEMAVVEERWPVFAFRHAGVPSGKVEEVYINALLPATQMAVVLYWSSPDATGKRVVWSADLAAVPVGGAMSGDVQTVTGVCTDSPQGEALNRSVLVFDELAAADELASIRIYRDNGSSSDDNLVANLHRVVVLMA